MRRRDAQDENALCEIQASRRRVHRRQSRSIQRSKGASTSLKKFVKEEGITWPQYYQGKGWKGDFSKSWGINSIPCVFVVDTDGKLYSVEARGKLEEIIPELLKKNARVAAASRSVE